MMESQFNTLHMTFFKYIIVIILKNILVKIKVSWNTINETIKQMKQTISRHENNPVMIYDVLQHIMADMFIEQKQSTEMTMNLVIILKMFFNNVHY